jgi:hypothetical protein
MYETAYEERLFGRAVNDDERPARPNVIKLGIEAVGRDHYRHDWRGHWIWSGGNWTGPFKLPEFIREANIRLKAQGRPQISANPTWVVGGNA